MDTPSTDTPHEVPPIHFPIPVKKPRKLTKAELAVIRKRLQSQGGVLQ